MEKVIACLGLLCAACGNVESLRADDISGLQNRSTTWVYGIVMNARTGAPIEGVTVLVGGRSDVAKRDGTYRIDGLAAIEATGSTSVHGFGPASLFFKLETGANLRDIFLEPNECGRSDCRPNEFCSGNQCVSGATLTGTVVNGCTGGPLDARVTVDGKSVCANDVKTGFYKLENLTPGAQIVAVGKVGWQAFSRTITLNAGPNAMDAVTLMPQGGCSAMPAPAACQP